jgi:hypothetical protein
MWYEARSPVRTDSLVARSTHRCAPDDQRTPRVPLRSAPGKDHTFNESATVGATRTGSTVTCTVTIPYSWPLLTPNSDMITIAYALSSPVTPASQGAGVLLIRLGSGTVATIKVPANGTTTTESVTASF